MESESIDRRMVREATLGLLVLIALLALLSLTVYLKARTLWEVDDERLLTQAVNVYTLGHDNALVPTKLPPLVPLPNIESNEIVDLGEIRPMAPARLAEWLGNTNGGVRIASVEPNLPLGLDPTGEPEADQAPTPDESNRETPPSTALPALPELSQANPRQPSVSPIAFPNGPKPTLPEPLPTLQQIPERATGEAPHAVKPNSPAAETSSGTDAAALPITAPSDNRDTQIATTAAPLAPPTPNSALPALPTTRSSSPPTAVSPTALSPSGSGSELPPLGLPPSPGDLTTSPRLSPTPSPPTTVALPSPPPASQATLNPASPAPVTSRPPTSGLPTSGLPTVSLPAVRQPTLAEPSVPGPTLAEPSLHGPTLAVPAAATVENPLPGDITRPAQNSEPAVARSTEPAVEAPTAPGSVGPASVPSPTYTVDQLKAAMRRVPLVDGTSLADLSQQLYGNGRYAQAILQLNRRRANGNGQFPPGSQVIVLPAEMFEFVYPDLIAAESTESAPEGSPVQQVTYADSGLNLPQGMPQGTLNAQSGSSNSLALPPNSAGPRPTIAPPGPPVRRSVLEPATAGPPAPVALPREPDSEWIVTEGGESLFQLAGEYLDQASHYVTLYQWNFELLEGRYRPTDPLPRGLRLRVAPPTQR